MKEAVIQDKLNSDNLLYIVGRIQFYPNETRTGYCVTVSRVGTGPHYPDHLIKYKTYKFKRSHSAWKRFNELVGSVITSKTEHTIAINW